MARNVFCTICVLVAFSAFLVAGSRSSSWKKGTVVSADVNGHGQTQNATGRNYHLKQDIWWNYRITAECFSYSVVARRSPRQAGLHPNHSVRFLEKRSRICVLDRDGKMLSLRITRKDKIAKCR